MKIAINKTYGGYLLDNPEYYQCERNDEILIHYLEEYPEHNPGIKVVEIPDKATDWRVMDYDGLEWVVYVVDGKIYESDEE